MPVPLLVLSSMATREVLGELLRGLAQEGLAAALESVGGVDAAKRVAAGEHVDVVVLSGDAIDRLAAAGHLRAGSRVDLVRSGIAAAVRAGAPRPPLHDVAALERALLAAPSIGYSTGPSGTHLLQRFADWGIADALRPRLVQAPPGVPVAKLVADGSVALGFQQLAELVHAPGIDIAGPLPEGAQAITVFAGAVATPCGRVDEAQRLLAALAAPGTAEAKRRHGLEPA